jgi:uncharacterized protein YhfF
VTLAAELWAAYVAATGASGPYTAWGFGGPEVPELMTRLGLLVRDGPKRATTSLLSDYERDGDPLPAVGEHSVILGGTGDALCITRVTDVEVRPFGEVDEAFAWVEGEGDRSLAYWREAHLRFFAAMGTPVDDATPVLLERFAKVWPPPIDPPA